MSNFSSLSDLGWQPFFQQQLSLDEWDEAIPARVVEQYKSEITLATESGILNIHLLANSLDKSRNYHCRPGFFRRWKINAD